MSWPTEDDKKRLHDALDEAQVKDISSFITKYGRKFPGILVGEFIRRAPAFEGDVKLVAELGEMMSDLETALTDFTRKSGDGF